MDKYTEARFDRLQKALADLIDSIVKNNPSPGLGKDLVTADDDLADALQKLETHQNNWVKIQKLRQETSVLDARIRDNMKTLWEQRQELKKTPTTKTTSDSPVHPFTVDQLLGFARRLAPHSKPPPGVENGLGSTTNEATPAVQQEIEAGASTSGPSVTPAGASAAPSAAPTPAPIANGESQPGEASSQATAVSSTSALPENLRTAVNPNAGREWQPWVTPEMMWRGGLNSYHRLVAQGIDPKGHDPAEEERKKKELEEQKKEQEEKQRLEREENERRMMEDRQRAMRERQARENDFRRGSVAEGASGPPRAPEKKQFQFMGGMDDDEDDD